MGLSPEGIKPRFLSNPLEFDGVKIVFCQSFCKYNLPFSALFSSCQLLLKIGLVTHFRWFSYLKNPNSKLKIRNSKLQNGLRWKKIGWIFVKFWHRWKCWKMTFLSDLTFVSFQKWHRIFAFLRARESLTENTSSFQGVFVKIFQKRGGPDEQVE